MIMGCNESNTASKSNNKEARREKFKKGVQKAANVAYKAGKVASKVGDILRVVNHPEWYENGSYFANPIGVNYSENKSAILYEAQDPDEGRLSFSPVLGRDMELILSTYTEGDKYQSYRSAMVKTLQQLTASSGRVPNYKIDDVAGYEYNARTIFAMLCSATRAWIACHNTDPADTSIPYLYGAMFKFQVDDWTSQVGAISDALKIAWHRFLDVYPISGDIFDRTFWLFMSVFADYEGPKPSLISCSLNSAHLISKDANHNVLGDMFSGVAKRNSVGNVENKDTWNAVYTQLTKALKFFEDIYLGTDQVADRQKAYGFTKNVEFANKIDVIFSSSDISIVPIVDEYMLRQMQNAKFVEGYAFIPTGTMTAEENYTELTGTLEYTHSYANQSAMTINRSFLIDPNIIPTSALVNVLGSIQSASNTWASRNYINGYAPDLSSGMLKSITRLHPTFGTAYGSDVSGGKTIVSPVVSMGSEVPVRTAIIFMREDGNGIVRSNEATFYCEYKESDTSDIQTYPVRQSTMINLYGATNIDYSPLYYWEVRSRNSATDVNEQLILPFWDFALFADASTNTLASLNAVSVYSLLYRDIAGASISSESYKPKLPITK